mmetsp:Transcript_27165/g.79126  ORF Transcript_27165/g.79126 Transcript_27165/m.79126 type:complete len:278 (-) Transcript_27165:1188-2021(-)
MPSRRRPVRSSAVARAADSCLASSWTLPVCFARSSSRSSRSRRKSSTWPSASASSCSRSAIWDLAAASSSWGAAAAASTASRSWSHSCSRASWAASNSPSSPRTSCVSCRARAASERADWRACCSSSSGSSTGSWLASGGGGGSLVPSFTSRTARSSAASWRVSWSLPRRWAFASRCSARAASRLLSCRRSCLTRFRSAASQRRASVSPRSLPTLPGNSRVRPLRSSPSSPSMVLASPPRDRSPTRRAALVRPSSSSPSASSRSSSSEPSRFSRARS